MLHDALQHPGRQPVCECQYGVRAYARYYLDTHNYPMAAQYAMVVVGGGSYALANSEEAMAMEYTYDQGSEPIFQMEASLAENGSGTNDAYLNGSSYPYVPTGFYLAPFYMPSGKALGHV